MVIRTFKRYSNMKTSKIVVILAFLAAMGLTACSNKDISFDDFDYQTVYFSSQFPVRTVELGEDPNVDLTLDNQHKIEIQAQVGGVWVNNHKERTITFEVDNSLTEGLLFANTEDEVVPMPASYYTLASNQIVIPSGSTRGGVIVQLNDAFFSDPKSLERMYVIPLVMTGVQGADSILQGKELVDNPNRCIGDDWTVAPKDFTLYAVKYVNPWHGIYLRRGTDVITTPEGTETVSRLERPVLDEEGNPMEDAAGNPVMEPIAVEQGEKVDVVTKGLKVNNITLTAYDSEGTAVPYTLTLTFTDDGSCTISNPAEDSDKYVITGTGRFISKGEKNSIGGKDRDAIYLDYDVDFKTMDTQYATEDILVLQTRNVKPEYYTVVKKPAEQ